MAFFLGECSARTKDKIVSYGELLSSHIIAAALNAQEVKREWVNARTLITTNDHFGMATVNFGETNTQIKHFFANSVSNLFVVPDFIAATKIKSPPNFCHRSFFAPLWFIILLTD
ncbi:MAG: hypothetical protein ACKVOM_01160 [Ferruginibacter sp.]